ncbi:MAG: hypothetical protein HYX97_02705 [Chloroflexi bacterium]|nr:hypothetical protein [Chloroflexota bacterium]
MRLDFAFVCDYAELGSKINALGIGFDTIYAPKVPATHPHLHLVAQLRASIAEAGEKHLSVSLIDADGKEVQPPVTGAFNLPKPQGATESVGRIAIAFNNTTFPRYGEYSIHMTVQGNELVRIPLRVLPTPEQR